MHQFGRKQIQVDVVNVKKSRLFSVAQIDALFRSCLHPEIDFASASGPLYGDWRLMVIQAVRLSARRAACSGLAFFILLTATAVFASSASPSVHLHGKVVDENGMPVEGLEVQIQTSGESIQVIHTDIAGKFEYSGIHAGAYRLSLNKAGFFRLTDQSIELQQGDNALSFTINHETEIHEQVVVYSSSHDIDPVVTTHSDRLIAREIRDIPVPSTHDLRNSLLTLPEVVQDNSGQLHIAGGRTGETQYLLDGFAIGDPVSGSLSVRVNVDSVRAAELETGRYSTQYGRAGAGVLSLDTTVGDDRWRAGATNIFPGVSAERGIHLTSWYPRFTLSGPLRKERAWFSEALSIQRTLSLVEDLPRNEDSITQWAGDNMLRVQIKLTPNNILHGNFLYNQVRASNLGLNVSSPISTTRKLQSYRSFFSIKEQVWSNRTFYELGIAGDYSHSDNRPHGFNPYTVMPGGSSGNYFESLWERTWRWQAIGSIIMPTRRKHGAHDIQLGFTIAELGWNHAAKRNPIEVIRADKTLLQRTDFSGSSEFSMSDIPAGGYGCDTWRVSRALVLQLSLRADYDRTLHHITPSPRISANFLPFKSDRTKLTAAWGIFLQPATLSTLGPAYDQHRSDIFYSRQAPDPVLGSVTSTFILPREHLKQPRFYTTSIGWEQSMGNNSQAAFNFTRRNGRFGLAYEKIDGTLSENLFLLQNNRRDHYTSFQISFRHSFSDKTTISASYVRSRARTNRIFDYSLNTPVFAPQQSGPQGWDAPNRLISSGWAPLPIWNLFASYFFEYRTGYPFSVIDEQQQLIGPANRMRLPNYGSLNVGLEKQLKLFTRKWAVRMTISNITNHTNADGADNNIDSSNFLHYFGGQRRSVSARVRLVG
jgi:hypothetical protein